MLQPISLPPKMPGDDVVAVGESFHRLADRFRPGLHVGVGKIPKSVVLGAFDETAAVENLFVREPHDDIIGCVALAGIENAEGPPTDRKGSIAVKGMGRLWFAFFFAPLQRFGRRPGGDAFGAVIVESGSAVIMEMRSETKDHFFVMSFLDGVE